MIARLGIRVIGPRYGESVVLELPDGGVGVIDSFAARRGRNPISDYISAEFPNLKSLRFFAITHPHADHCFRAAEVLEKFPAEEIWIFRPFPAGQVQDYFKALQNHGSIDDVEAAIGLPAGSVADSLLQLHSMIRVSIKKGTPVRYLASYRNFTFCNGSLRVHFLTPGERFQYLYADHVEKAARAIFSDGPALIASGRLPQPEHNLASCGILVEFGSTRALLMADAENPLWEEWLQTNPGADLRKPVHFLKTAHHGSSNGYHSPLYDDLMDRNQTLAIITPFNHGNVHLPSAQGVNAIRTHVRELYCTNRLAASASTQMKWVHPTVAPNLPPIPARWVAMMRRTPTLARLLVPESGVISSAGKIPSVPPRWLIDVQKNNALWELIRPDCRLTAVTPISAREHLISAYYDSSGNLLDLQVGLGAGRLA